jgi:hypothetical protein
MEKHLRSRNFRVLIGATRVLGETFEMNIADILETGNHNLVKEWIASQ